MGLLLPDEDEKVRIMKCYHYTKDKKKYQAFNDRVAKILYKSTSLFSFRIANKQDYTNYRKGKNQSSANHFLAMYNHNFRKANFKTDLLRNSQNIQARDLKPNEYKEYIAKDSFLQYIKSTEKKRANKKNITLEIKKLKMQLARAQRTCTEYYEKYENFSQKNREIPYPRYVTESQNFKTKQELDKKSKHFYKKYKEYLKKCNDIESKIKKLESQKIAINGNAELFKEVVINVKESTTIANIESALKILKSKIPILAPAEVINIAIHRDEGHINFLSNRAQMNYHAHIIFNNINPKTNKTIFKGRELTNQLENIQTIMAEALEMQKGQSGSKEKHKNKWQRDFETKKVLQELKLMLPALENEIQKDSKLELEIKNKKDELSQFLKDSGLQAARDKLKSMKVPNNLNEFIISQLQILKDYLQDPAQTQYKEFYAKELARQEALFKNNDKEFMQDMESHYLQRIKSVNSNISTQEALVKRLENEITYNPTYQNIQRELNSLESKLRMSLSQEWQPVYTQPPAEQQPTIQQKQDIYLAQPLDSQILINMQRMYKNEEFIKLSRYYAKKLRENQDNPPVLECLQNNKQILEIKENCDKKIKSIATTHIKAINDIAQKCNNPNDMKSNIKYFKEILELSKKLNQPELKAYIDENSQKTIDSVKFFYDTLQNIIQPTQSQQQAVVETTSILDDITAMFAQEESKDFVIIKENTQQNIIQPTNAQQQGISNNNQINSQPKVAPAQPKTKPKAPVKKPQSQGRGM